MYAAHVIRNCQKRRQNGEMDLFVLERVFENSQSYKLLSSHPLDL